jgi:ABC-2 type transport system permease protein
MNLKGVYAIWWREMTVFMRETPRVVSAIVSPVIWLFIFGAGLGASVNIQGIDYQQFIFAGVITQTFLFTSIFYGAYLVWDKRIDLLKSILVSPLSRATIFFGKVLGGVTISVFESLIVLFFGIFIGIQYTPMSFLMTVAVVIIASAIFTSIGLTIGSTMESPEGFQLLSSFLLFPLFFLSGALFPLDNLPGWLSTVTSVNPVTYVVDMLRGTLVGNYHFDPSHNLLLLGVFLVITSAIGVEAFRRMKS